MLFFFLSKEKIGIQQLEIVLLWGKFYAPFLLCEILFHFWHIIYIQSKTIGTLYTKQFTYATNPYHLQTDLKIYF